jgi:membrane-associated HD superfamily phosphohydrolase
MNTNQQYDKAVDSCKEIFLQKTKDYGTSWRVYRTISVADQIYIKAKRIRTIQEKGVRKIGDDIISEFKGILNYGIIGLIQLDIADDELEELPVETVQQFYNDKVAISKKLMQDKNHDYGEAWREMSQESFVDLVLSKILRIKQILVNKGETIISEGIDANFYDIINYAAFALILIEEELHGA